jgi:hypothetical protein
VRLCGFRPLTHLNGKAQEIKARFSGVPNVRLGLVETKTQSLQHMAHHFQGFPHIFSLQHHKVFCVAHEIRPQFFFQLPPLPYPVENMRVAVGQ